MSKWSLIAVVLLSAGAAWGQLPAPPPTFSVDNASPACGMVPCNGADILAPVPPAPGLAPPPLLAPGIVIPGGVGGLGLVGLGGPPEIDALSYGTDPQPMESDVWYFSVDRAAVGIVGLMLPSVTTEGARVGAPPGGGAKEASADVFESKVSGPLRPPVAPPVPFGNNIGFYDGNGAISASGAVYPGLGLNVEPNPGGDDLDAFDLDTLPGPNTPVYFSLDPNTAAANGFAAGDVLVVPAGGSKQRYASANGLGLDLAGIGADDLDAMVLAEDGDGVFNPGVDQLLFSVKAGSQVIGQPDSMWGVGIEEGDILMDPAWSQRYGGVGGLTPGILIPAEYLGLETVRSYNAADDLDALDVPEPASVALLGLGAVLIGRRRKRRA